MGLTLIKSLTAAGDSELEFIDGTDDVVMDNTYNEYQFYFVNMHPETNGVDFQFQVNATDDAGGDYDANAPADTSVITSTTFRAYHDEAGTSTDLTYNTADDQEQGAAYQTIGNYIGGGAGNDDESCSGVLTIYDPSSPTYVKHFVARSSDYMAHDQAGDYFTAGYINDTTAIDEIRFKMSYGKIDDGTIYMYGVS